MAEEFEVKGLHDEHLERVGESNHEHSDKFGSRLAVMTALFATVGALFSYQVGSTQNEAAMSKNNAAIVKTEAGDQWNYYQAKSNRQNLAELAMDLPGLDAGKYKANAARYSAEKEAIKKEAEKLEAQSRKWDEASEALMHQHHRWAQAMVALQIAIALAAITLLTRKKWMQWGSYGVAAAGVALGFAAWMHF
ncbi:DUF4337 domain-containing protein [Paralcaligenes ureilyticus]|uniref:Uncharacterized protein DUF4337 n=1 Tax=Paralcaligenes ureilyticus TaxID=627131 RepID=A0A4R3MCJ1_9BURK|nr:DUF4337 domain-containing protein [Paralcaligenes ureilyticus]TCT09727.1 uncharacterized protein DUF4337 [Paralcaligenes ureilyticus]